MDRPEEHRPRGDTYVSIGHNRSFPSILQAIDLIAHENYVQYWVCFRLNIAETVSIQVPDQPEDVSVRLK